MMAFGFFLRASLASFEMCDAFESQLALLKCFCLPLRASSHKFGSIEVFWALFESQFSASSFEFFLALLRAASF